LAYREGARAVKTGRKILLAALGLVVAAGLLYIADWLWLGAAVRGEVLQAFERRGVDSEVESDFWFDGGDAGLRLGMPGIFHDFRQAVVVLKYSYETDSVVYDAEDYGDEPYEEYDDEGVDKYAPDAGFEYVDENEADYAEGDGGAAYGEEEQIEEDVYTEDDEYTEEDIGAFAEEEDGESADETVGESVDESGYEPEDYESGDYADGQDVDNETYSTERVTSDVLVTVWLEFINWRWQVVDINYLYE
jgi:hypothetical protein